MIKINSPILENKDGKTFLKAFIENEKEGVSDWMWFASNEANGHYFCDEVADAFVLPMILRAIKTDQDIIVNAPMSARLLYNLNESVFYALSNKTVRKTGHSLGVRIGRVFLNACPILFYVLIFAKMQ